MKQLSVQWHITDNCDQRCKHCYIFSDPAFVPNNTPKEKVYDVIKKLNDYVGSDGFLYTDFTGGDPFLHFDFWNIIEEYSKYHRPYGILGNPFHVDLATAIRLKQTGCMIYQQSIDGTREMHDWFRKEGSYDATFDAVKILNSVGIKTAIQTTVSGKNIDMVPSIIGECVKNKVYRYVFSRFVPTFDNELENDSVVTPEKYRKLIETCDKLEKRIQATGAHLIIKKKDHLWTLYEHEKDELKSWKFSNIAMEPDGRYGCLEGCHATSDKQMTILPNGYVLACRRIPNSIVGNIFRDPVEDILANKKSLMTYDEIEGCKDCKLVHMCRGCRAVACRGNMGEFFKRDPHCWKVVDNGTKV